MNEWPRFHDLIRLMPESYYPCRYVAGRYADKYVVIRLWPWSFHEVVVVPTDTARHPLETRRRDSFRPASTHDDAQYYVFYPMSNCSTSAPLSAPTPRGRWTPTARGRGRAVPGTSILPPRRRLPIPHAQPNDTDTNKPNPIIENVQGLVSTDPDLASLSRTRARPSPLPEPKTRHKPPDPSLPPTSHSFSPDTYPT